MGRVLTNNTSLRVAIEASTGALPTEPQWTILEFDTVTAYGAVITTVPRRPIGTGRGRQKGIVTDLDSSVEYETDITMESLLLFGEGFMFAEYANVEFDRKETYGSPSLPSPPRVDGTTDDFDIDAASATLAGKVQFNGVSGIASLVFAKGYNNAANNGLHVLNADLAASGTAIEVASSLVTETSPPANATLEVVGIRNDDLPLAVNADLVSGTITTAGDVDFTTLGLFVGQRFQLGSPDSTGTAQNVPTIAATNIIGRARITALTATVITFDKGDEGIGAGGTGSSSGSETVDLMYGRFLRDRPVTSDSTDDRYLERTYHFEGSFPGLAPNGTDTEYEYALGNFGNSLEINKPLTDKVTGSFGFIGTNSDPITGTRKSNAGIARQPLRKAGFATGPSIASITTDVTSSASEVCFKSLTSTILNNVSPEKCLGTLGARFVNAGLFQFDIEGQMLFTNKAIVNSIRDNSTVTFAWEFANEDGVAAFDVPAMTLSGGGREYPVDQSVLVNITGASFTSNTFGYNLSISFFGAAPGVLGQAA